MSSVSSAGSQAFTAQAYLKQQQKAVQEANPEQPPAGQAEPLKTSGDRGTILNVTA